MFRDEKNLKDTNLPLSNLPLHRGRSEEGVLSYTKTNKLITALYMVTDIIERDEPLRHKLRTLGTEIISDINSLPTGQVGVPHKACGRIGETMSFLNLAKTMNILSAMNCDILLREFQELDRSIKESTSQAEAINRKIDLEDFLRDEIKISSPTRLGIQRGSTLLNSINKMSNKMPAPDRVVGPRLRTSDDSKRQRRDDILNIIKILGGSATIKDIKDKAGNMPDKGHSLNSFGEKTLQRELVSMVRDGVLLKEGSKRWSKYL